MPYVEGETLRDRINREKQLPVDEAVKIGTAVANALDHAHRNEVIHRDIKPANILMQDGEPVVADFGIALAVGAAGGSRLTETGLSLGTPFYMSPEQATGDRMVGPQSDTYALACVLYEMLTGDPPYVGSTAQAVLGKIIAGSVSAPTELRPSIPTNVTPPYVARWRKLPADRFTTAQEFAKALGDPGFRYGEEVAGVAGGRAGLWNWLSMATTGVAVVALGAAGWAFSRPEPPVSVQRFESPFRQGQGPIAFGIDAFNLSQDGASLVYRGPGEVGVTSQLWMRRWDDLDAAPVRAAALGLQPAVSPDGRELAFNQGNEIKVLSFDGGPTRTLTGGVWPRWGPDGYIYLGQGAGAMRVRASGGPVETVTEVPEGENTHFIWDFLPGGDRRARSHQPRRRQYRDSSPFTIDRGVQDDRRPGSDRPVRDQRAHRLSGRRRHAHGRAFRCGCGRSDGSVGAPRRRRRDVLPVAHRRTRVLGRRSYRRCRRAGLGHAYRAGDARRAGLVVRSRRGNYGWTLSPDQTKVALRIFTEGNNDIWIKHLPDGPLERLTFQEGEDRQPWWHPDGETLTYVSGTLGDRTLWSKRADGTGEPELLLDDERSFTQGLWSPDGELLVLRTSGLTPNIGPRDIVTFRPGVDSTVVPLIGTPEFAEQGPALSPDGRWIAYTSNETGQDEVYVRPFPDVNTTRIRVSTEGGLMPKWAHSGRELFFIDANRVMVSARVETASGFRVVGREALFELGATYLSGAGTDFYDITLDDQQFLMGRAYEGGEGAQDTRTLVLVQNFTEELKQRVGGG